MPAIIDSTSVSGLGGTGSENLGWTHNIGSVGMNGLIVVAAVGREQSGEENPEEINQITFNGVVMPFLQANLSQTGVAVGFLYGANIPVAGAYNVNVNYKDSPKQAEYKRGVCAVFRNVFNQNYEAQIVTTHSGNGTSTALSTLTNNALLLAIYGWRVGFVQSNVAGGLDEVVTNRGDNQAGITIYKKIVPIPASTTVTFDAVNPEDNGLILTSWRASKAGGGLIGSFF